MAGEITGTGMRVDVLDRVNATREGARLMKGYQPGHVVEFRTNLPSQGLRLGDRGVVAGVEGKQVRLTLENGKSILFQPDRLAKNLTYDAVSIYHVKQIELHVGDRIRWTDNDRERGMDNAAMARVEGVGDKLVVASLSDGVVHELRADDRMTERLDLAYAINAHIAQGVTTDDGIVALRSSERRQLSERSFLVAVTRIADKVSLIVDNALAIERGVTRNSGDKTSALDVDERGGEGAAIRIPDAAQPIDAAIERYARLFLTVGRLQVDGRQPTAGMMRELGSAGVALEKIRFGGAEDLRAVLDRLPDPGSMSGTAATKAWQQAWVEEAKLRTEPSAYAARFVKDWQAASAALSNGQAGEAEARAMQRIGRLEDRMARQPMLQQALGRSIPERQLNIPEPGSTGRTRERDFGMEM